MPGSGLWRILAVAACLTGVSGCAFLPPIIEQGYAVLTGISYLATSKGPADHALSVVMERDCASLRVLSGKPICRPISDDGNHPLGVTVIGMLGTPPAGLPPEERFTEFKPPLDPRLSTDPMVALSH